MPDEDVNVEAAVESFLAEDGNDSDETTETEETTAEAAETETTEAEGEAEEATEEEPAAAAEPTALQKAIDAGDPKAFIEALGDKAETLLGAKAHKALRLAAVELKRRETELKSNAETLLGKFKDPIAARKAVEKGGPEAVDVFVDVVERMFGASWAACRKFVDDGIAGKDARLEAKAKETSDAAAAETAKRADAEKSVRALITEHVRGANAKLLEADAGVVDDIYNAMKAGYKAGVNTPAKAWALVKKRYLALAAVLAPPPAETPARRPIQREIRPPRSVPQTPGKKPQDIDEAVAQFLKEEGWSGR